MQPTEPQLIYEDTGEPVAVGDIVRLRDRQLPSGEIEKVYAVVNFFRPPHKPASSGKVTLQPYNGYGKPLGDGYEVYVGVIGAKWINRTDREEPNV